jgi:hypothetical protein
VTAVGVQLQLVLTSVVLLLFLYFWPFELITHLFSPLLLIPIVFFLQINRPEGRRAPSKIPCGFLVGVVVGSFFLMLCDFINGVLNADLCPVVVGRDEKDDTGS